jgi:dihydrodipicolinate synthase/N-acetylneuraminate lyase
MPEILIKIYELVQERKYAEALKIQQLLNDFYSELLPDAGKDNGFNIAEEKYILSLRGICNECTTSYYRSLTSNEKEKIKALFLKYPIIPSQPI